MDIKRIKDKEIHYYLPQIVIDDLAITTRDYNVLVELCDVDGYTESIVIHDYEFKNKLEKLGLIKTNIRGSSYATEKLKEILPNIESLLSSKFIGE